VIARAGFTYPMRLIQDRGFRSTAAASITCSDERLMRFRKDDPSSMRRGAFAEMRSNSVEGLAHGFLGNGGGALGHQALQLLPQLRELRMVGLGNARQASCHRRSSGMG
jgi:hypothetical protein